MLTSDKVTLSMIAAVAKTSIASVSRVIHTPHLASKKMQCKVYQAIEQLNYDPKMRLKAHLPNKNNSKKLLVIDNQYYGFSLINQGINSRAEIEGYKLIYLHFYFFNEHEIQQMISYTINHNVEGILIINEAPYLKMLLEYQASLPPIVLINQFDIKFPCLYFDHVALGFQSRQHLIQKGHRDILLLLTNENERSNQQLENGYRQAFKRATLHINRERIVYQSHDYALLQKQLTYDLNAQKKPTAIICSDTSNLNYDDIRLLDSDQPYQNRQIIESVLSIIRQLPTVAANDLSLIYISNESAQLNSELSQMTSFMKPLYKMGADAVELLLSILANPFGIKGSMLLESEFIQRTSVKKRTGFIE